jgi:DNA mismatch repair protein MutS2
MNEKALKTLEFDKVITTLVDIAISPLGKEHIAKLLPLTDIEQINIAQKETTEATIYIIKKGSLPLGGIKNVYNSIKRSSIGGVLSIEELMNIGEFLYVCQKVIAYSKSNSKTDSFTILTSRFKDIVSCSNLKSEINRCIINTQEMSDNASSTLFNIRQNIKINNNKIKEQLNGIITSQKYKNMIQENVVTIRNGRYCIPIKQEYQSSFQGMVHDQSSTGATSFIEPLVSVQLNNKIKELLITEKKEIEHILAQLSLLVAENHELLEKNSEVITELDCIFAKGQYSISINGIEPVFNENKYINIKKGRHPLLDMKTVVPTNIYLGKEFNMLLITGPNTGGKTVALKTIGLFTLMGQSGLHIPADEKSELAVFDEVFSDIGDEQSIEQSLSTFSSHMTNIVNIIDKATNSSLILLDELGAGTDPTEGAALGISILTHLKNREIRTVVTTHYSELKVFALSTPKVENACCEFNVETLRPSYNILIGIPGKSNAFAISEKLGLPKFIIDTAKEQLSHEDIKFEDILTELEISKKEGQIEQARAKEYRLEALKLKDELESKKISMANQREKILNDAKMEARKILNSAKNDADILMKEFKKQIKNNSSSKSIEESRRNIGDRLGVAENELRSVETNNRVLNQISKKLVKGDKVFVNALNQTGTVVSNQDNGGNVMVQSGIINIKVNVKNLSEPTVEKTKDKKQLHRYVHKVSNTHSITNEINLLGCMVDEGIEKVDKFLDDAYLSSLSQITIIHGKGTGALRNAIHNHFKKHPHVKNYRLGAFGEGDAGVTIVELN